MRLLDFQAHRPSAYALQRELNAQGIEVEKILTQNAQALEIGMEGADKAVYFTHDYFSMVSCKNNFLIASAKIAKRQGLKQMIAVCPVEHDMAYSEDDKTWVEQRSEAEQEALSANSGLSILNTDLVYGRNSSFLTHYMAQCASVGSIKAEFLAENGAQFKPINDADLSRAITLGLDANVKGQFALRGEDAVTTKELLALIEQSVGKEAGSTGALREIPFFSPGRILEEFTTGICQDTNMAQMVDTFNTSKADPVTGDDFWSTVGSAPEEKLNDWFQGYKLDEEQLVEHLSRPSFGSYKTSFGDNSV